MREKLWFFVISFFSFVPVNAQLVTFDFAGLSGDEVSANSNFNATGVFSSTISRGTGAMAAANSDRFNSNQWTSGGTPDVSDYLTFTITPSSGYGLILNSVDIHHQRSGTGPVSFVIRTSLDGFASNATNELIIGDVTNTQYGTFTFLTSINTTAPVEIRLYAYLAEGSAGTWGPGDFAGNDLVIFGSASASTLPVLFTDVLAFSQGSGIRVEWTNLTESDVVHYSVERSANGTDFSSIGVASPTRNDGGPASYGWLDPSPLPGVNLYRIQSLEMDGRRLNSVIVRVDQKGGILTLYPNPVKDVLVVQKELPRGDYQVRILNAMAQEVYQLVLKHDGGVRTQTIDVSNLTSGIYYLWIGEKVVRFVK